MVTLLTRQLLRAAGDSLDVRVRLPVRFMPRSEPQRVSRSSGGRRTLIAVATPTAKDVLLLIEVSDSTLRYDLEDKARLYAKHRIQEYWVVDVANRRIVRHRMPHRGGYAQCDQVASGAVPLPSVGAELSLAAIF